jgi:hypothetical protein
VVPEIGALPKDELDEIAGNGSARPPRLGDEPDDAGDVTPHRSRGAIREASVLDEDAWAHGTFGGFPPPVVTRCAESPRTTRVELGLIIEAR